MSVIELHDVVVTADGRRLVDVPALRLEAGRPLTLVGESGSGKSLLAHALMGTLPAALAVEGDLIIDGRRLPLADPSNRRAMWGNEIAMLPQEPALALDPTMRVIHQVAEGARGAARGAARSRARAALAEVGLAESARAFPHVLSGGMAQRVAYAAATLGGARVLVVDEPSKGLDAASVDRLGELLLDHVGDGGLLLTITHDLRLATALGGDVAIMRAAAVVEAGPVAEVLQRPQHDYTRQLVDADPARWRHPWQRTDWEASGDPIVQGVKISKSYGDQRLFADLDVTVHAGERLALCGPSGVGKTTLGNALLRITQVDAGRVEHAVGLAGGKTQKLYQDPSMSFPALVPIEAGLRDVARRHGQTSRRIEELMSAVGLSTSLLARLPGEVSGGEIQRIAIVRALLVEPALVLADEATSRLDLLTQAVTIDALMRELGAAALVMVTHDEALADAVADSRLELGADRRELSRVN